MRSILAIRSSFIGIFQMEFFLANQLNLIRCVVKVRGDETKLLVRIRFRVANQKRKLNGIGEKNSSVWLPLFRFSFCHGTE